MKTLFKLILLVAVVLWLFDACNAREYRHVAFPTKRPGVLM